MQNQSSPGSRSRVCLAAATRRAAHSTPREDVALSGHTGYGLVGDIGEAAPRGRTDCRAAKDRLLVDGPHVGALARCIGDASGRYG